jgi:uncharacterized protein (TIGR03067 family)
MVWLATDSAGSGAPKKGAAELQGAWRIVSVEANGKAQDFIAGQPRWLIRGKKVQRAGEELAVLTTDPTTTPKAIDLKLLRPERVFEGIYAVDGDTLRVCVNVQPDGVKERPLKLSTKDQPQWRMLVFERVKAGEKEEPIAGFVGLALRINPDRGEVSVADVIKDSPAQKAGMKKDDLVLQIGAVQPTTLREAIDAVREARPGSKLMFRVKRGGKEQEITIQPGVVPFFLLD